MAGLEADISHFKQLQLPAASPFDTVKEIAGVQQQKQQIDQAKMDQANQAMGYMVRAMGSLGPNAKKEDYAKAAQNAVDQGLVPQQQENIFLQHLQAAPDSASFYKQFMSSAMETQKQLDFHIGTNAEKSNGATNYQGVTKPPLQGGGFVPSTQMPVQMPPTTPGFDASNNPQFQGPSGPPGVQPVAPMPRPRPMPVQQLTTGPTGDTVDRTPVTPTTFDNRFAGALRPGTSPLFGEGKEAYAKDQLNASARAQAIKPAIQALKLMPGLATGPGTEQFNNLVAAAKAWGVVDTAAENDKTVMRQELNKKMAQYVGNSPIGQRSDAAQTLAEAGSPNPKVQLTQALQSLTRDAIALDRVQILKPNAFKGTDYQNYIKHTGTFPQSLDEKALTLDLLDNKERDTLIKKMATQYRNGDAKQKKEAEKFITSLKAARDAGIYDGAE